MPSKQHQVLTYQRESERCPFAAVVEIVGERWAFLILRGAVMGLCHFEEFQSCLEIARNILSDRLAKLVAAGLLERAPDPHDRRRIVYTFTEKGRGFLPVIVALRQWGLDCGLAHPKHPVMSDSRDLQPIQRLEVRSHDGRALSFEDIAWVGEDGQALVLPHVPRMPRSEAA